MTRYTPNFQVVEKPLSKNIHFDRPTKTEPREVTRTFCDKGLENMAAQALDVSKLDFTLLKQHVKKAKNQKESLKMIEKLIPKSEIQKIDYVQKASTEELVSIVKGDYDGYTRHTG